MSEKTYRAIWSTPRASGKLASQIEHVINVAMIEEATDIKISVETPDETALRKRLVEAMSIVKEMDCECGFETGSEESYLPAICFKHLLYEILDSETHKPLEEKK